MLIATVYYDILCVFLTIITKSIISLWLLKDILLIGKNCTKTEVFTKNVTILS